MGIFSKLALAAVAAVGVEGLELKKVRASMTMAKAKSEAEKEGAKGCKLSIDGKDATNGIPDDATAQAYDAKKGSKSFKLVCEWEGNTQSWEGKSSNGGGMSNNGGGDDNKGSCECK